MTDKIRILIADADEVRGEEIETKLDLQQDMTVVGRAVSVQQFLELSQNKDYDMILMDTDIDISGDGIGLAKQILAEQPLVHIIFWSKKPLHDTVVEAMGMGAKDFLKKEYSDEMVCSHIRSVVEGNPIMDDWLYQIVMQEYVRLQKSEKSLMFFINNISKLTVTERELLKLLLEGYRVNEIPKVRCVESSTVKTQIKGLLHKFGCSRTKEIVRMVHELQIEHLL